MFHFQNCHDYIEAYSISNVKYNCRPNNCPKWQKVSTIFGACCSFNYFPMMLSNVTAINLSRSLAAINILYSGRNLPAQGLSLIISYAGEYITPYDSSFKLYPGIDNFYRINVEQVIPNSNFRRLSFQSRRCMLSEDTEEDANAAIYRSWCTFNCVLKNIYKECHCHPFSMPFLIQQSASMRDCEVKDIPCFTDKTSKIQFVKFCLFCLSR